MFALGSRAVCQQRGRGRGQSDQSGDGLTPGQTGKVYQLPSRGAGAARSSSVGLVMTCGAGGCTGTAPQGGPRLPGAAREMWAGHGARGYECRQTSPSFYFVGKHVCFTTFIDLPLTCFSNSSEKPQPGVGRGVTSPAACAALIKWLHSRGFDLFLKRAPRCLLPPSHQQAKPSPKALGSAAAARGGS